MANLAAALIKHGKIQTTLPKAKALRPFVERIISMAKRAKNAPTPERALYLRRLAVSRVRDNEAIAILFNEKVEEFLNREGGYTRIYKLGNRRGDAAEMALIQLIPADDEGYSKSRKKGSAKPKAVKAAAQEEAPTAGAAAAAAEAESVAVAEAEPEAPEAAEEEASSEEKKGE
ncbi:MAG: large subunit ribosomal protein L17 [Puniceicoccaceae bacterium 5H]|nr:MAG: large subunit ribosomal protein L17 [Puniceicoccaceae bacterium 5H]